MTTNYDQLAESYQSSKTNPIKQYSEQYTFLGRLGDVRGKAILDVACGDGDYTRRLKRLGAAEVIGVDISERMVAKARAIERTDPLGLDYRVQDVAHLAQIGAFDLITAVYLFPYAPTRQALDKMVRALAANLKSEGRLLAVTTNPALEKTDLSDLTKYGTKMELAEPLEDGAPVIATLFTAAGDIRLSTTYWSQATYERVFVEAGFEQVTWHRMRVSHDGLQAHGEAYWRTYLANPIIVLLEATKR